MTLFHSFRNLPAQIPDLILVFIICLASISSAHPMPDAEARKLLQSWRKQSADYIRRSSRTAFFCRAQLKYGLERRDYLHRWSDRPLMQDSSYRPPASFSPLPRVEKTKNFISLDSYRAEAALLRQYSLNGLAFFPETKNRLDILNYCSTPGSEMELLPEYFIIGKNFSEKAIDERVKIAGKFLHLPNSFRIDGKVVLTSYPVSQESKDWKKLKKALIRKYGNHFLVIPWGAFHLGIKPTGKHGTYSSADILQMRDRLRTWLRDTDGFYYNSPAISNRRYQAEFDREVILPIVHSVMQEPEFKHKYLGWGIKVGHMNSTLLGYIIDAYGTDTLRGTLETARLARPDFINCIEWDEENENTCFRPIVTTGFSTLRMVRYFAQKMNGRQISKLPEDDPSVPNLVVSYRRILQCGQPLEIEVANIPDGTAAKDFTVAVVLKDRHGKELKRFSPKNLSSERLSHALFVTKASDLVNSQIIKVFLEVSNEKGRHIFGSSFCPIEVRSNWNWDYLWVKHVLREQIRGVQAQMQLIPRKDGLVELTGKVFSPTALRSMEILDGIDVIYSYDKNNEYLRSDDENLVFRISFQAHGKSPLQIPLRSALIWSNTTPKPVDQNGYQIKGSSWILQPGRINVWNRNIFAAVPRKELKNAQVSFNIPEVIDSTVSLMKVLERGICGFSGEYGFNLIIEPFYSQAAMPSPVNQKHIQFKALLRPKRANSVFHMQLVDQNYHIWRGAEQTLYHPSGKKRKISVFQVLNNRPEKCSVDETLLTEFNYQFNPENGPVFRTASGTEQYGMLGGFSTLASGVGRGENGYGNAVHGYILRSPAEAFRQTAPEYRRTAKDGCYLHFNGSSNFVSLPLSLIPPFGSFTFEIEIRPQKIQGTQTIFSNFNQGFTLMLDNDIPTAVNWNQSAGAEHQVVKAYGPPIQPGIWQKLTVCCNQRTLQIFTGKTGGKAVPSSGYHLYSRSGLLGAKEWYGNFFHGDIRKFKVLPYSK